MNKQRLLFGFTQSEVINENVSPFEINILTWNISNPSITRAYKQFDWLIKTEANVIILTEAKYSEGCLYLRDALESVGFKVYYTTQNNDYCVILAEKGFNSQKWPVDFPFLPHRLESIILNTFLGDLKILGVYVPSRGPKEKRNINKRLFQDQLINLLYSFRQNEEIANIIIGGDLNVIDPYHVPRYPVFSDWEYEFYNTFLKVELFDTYRLLNPNTQEYSWFGKYGDGYRFDYFFVSQSITHIPQMAQVGYN